MNSTKRKQTKWFRQKRILRLLVYVAVAFIGVLIYVLMINNQNRTVNPSTLRPVLNLIARAESNGNYNAYFGSANNRATKFTEMSIDEVLKWQGAHVAKGSPSSAVGRYQIINTTLDELVRELNIDSDKLFDEAMQDRLAIALISRRGATDYVNNRLSAEQFAANLAKEWAALPRVIGDSASDSYYASDGLNQSRVGIETAIEAIRRIQPLL